MRFLKYLGEHGRPPTQADLEKRTSRGYPIKGPVHLLKRQELESLPCNFNFHVKTFDLSKPEDLAEYQAVWDHVTARLWKFVGGLPKETFHDGRYLVLAKWVEIVAVVPPAVAARAV
jgi:hypothetical protein